MARLRGVGSRERGDPPAGREAARAPTPEASDAAAKSSRRFTPVNDVLKQCATALTARAKTRNVVVDVNAVATRRIARAGTLRECFLVLLADTLDTAARGSVVRVDLKDLAGDRVELAIRDQGTMELPNRAEAARDGSGRARSLARAFDLLDREHSARWVSACDADGRRLLVDVGFPNE